MAGIIVDFSDSFWIAWDSGKLASFTLESCSMGGYHQVTHWLDLQGIHWQETRLGLVQVKFEFEREEDLVLLLLTFDLRVVERF